MVHDSGGQSRGDKIKGLSKVKVNLASNWPSVQSYAICLTTCVEVLSVQFHG